jgi:hypothetical protein
MVKQLLRDVIQSRKPATANNKTIIRNRRRWLISVASEVIRCLIELIWKRVVGKIVVENLEIHIWESRYLCITY